MKKKFSFGKILTKTEQQQITASGSSNCQNQCGVDWLQCLWQGTSHSQCLAARNACLNSCG
ncbi:hypothetical protein [Aquimarina sp. 2201CG5-10]|uniref:hypothetical protein n=1 Tax=Aquimarina callyspongiae TaxID=3098150 RepID=UPI002AB4050F|nr:hypothetical protein [Aquimarina sp. 2201CG5-10]MDY8137859.1 hypothetical protein [Aquimarina sp. 2201CG5-10]